MWTRLLEVDNPGKTDWVNKNFFKYGKFKELELSNGEVERKWMLRASYRESATKKRRRDRGEKRVLVSSRC